MMNSFGNGIYVSFWDELEMGNSWSLSVWRVLKPKIWVSTYNIIPLNAGLSIDKKIPPQN
jgi:hypothetical protein